MEPDKNYSPVSTLKDPCNGDNHSPEHNKVDDEHPSTNGSLPAQVMQQSTNSPPYRIPSAVFERNPSSNPADWSATSNESLFSIPTGNMSFTKDPTYWRSGELGLAEEPSTSGQLLNFSGNLTPGDLGITDHGGKSTGELLAFETMQEVLLENARKQDNEGNHQPIAITRQEFDSSHGSNRSFAFPILAVEDSVAFNAKVNVAVEAKTRSPEKPMSELEVQPQEQAEARTQPTRKSLKRSQNKCFPCNCISCWPFRS